MCAIAASLGGSAVLVVGVVGARGAACKQSGFPNYL